jgi:hypothetical protein
VDPSVDALPPAGSWRAPLAWWPAGWRKRWADRAEALQAEGLPWDRAEWVAFLEAVADINAAEAAGEWIDFRAPADRPDPTPFPDFDSLPGAVDIRRALEANQPYRPASSTRPRRRTPQTVQ